MVVSTYKELIFKKSKKQHQILAQTAYYQAGKIVIQTILPEQPPVALITLNTLGTTCSTSADTYIPIENISNTQSCSFLESRLVSLYGGKAASLLIEYQQRLSLYLTFNVHPSASLDKNPFSKGLAPPSEAKLPSDSCYNIFDVKAPTSFTSCSGKAQEMLERSKKQMLVQSKKGEPAPYQKMLAKQSLGVKASNKYSLNAGLLSRRVTEWNRKEGFIDKVDRLPSLKTSSNGEAMHLKGAPLRSKGTPGFSKVDNENFKKIEVRGNISISSSFDNILSEGDVSAKQERGTHALLKGSLSISEKKVNFANDFVDNTFIYTNKEPISYFKNLINNVQSWVSDPSKTSPLQTGLTKGETKGSSLLNIEDVSKGFIDEVNGLNLDYYKTHFAKIYFAGTGNNIFQSTLGNLEIQTATRLASIMVNYWNFYSLNKKTTFLWPQHKTSASFPNVKPLLTSKMLSKGEPFKAPYKNMQSSYSKEALVSFSSSNKAEVSTKHGFANIEDVKQSKSSLLNGYNVQDVSTNIDNVDVSKSKKGSSKTVPSLLHKPKKLVELNSYVFERNQRQAFFAMQSRRLDRAVFSCSAQPLSLAALQTYYSASFDRKPFRALSGKARLCVTKDQTSLSDKMLANQSVRVKGQRDLRSKGFQETAEGYKPQPAPDSYQLRKNFVTSSVQGKPLFSRLFTPKQYKALRFYRDREHLLCSAKPSEIKDTMVIPLLSFAYPKGLAKLSQESEMENAGPFRVVRSDEGVKESKPLLAPYEKYKVKVLDIKSKVKDKTPKDLHFAIVQSKNSLKICENKNFSYHIRRLSVENIGSYSQLNNNNFQLLNSLQFSNLRRDRFSPHWFRLYLPDIEATEFLKNVANYYFNLGLQTLTLPSTKLNPFATFLDKHTLNPRSFYSSDFLLQRSINTSYYNLLTSYESPINYTRPLGVKQRLCIGKPPSETITSSMLARCEEVESLEGWVSTARSKKVFTAKENKKSIGSTLRPNSSINEVTPCFTSLEMKALWGTRGLQNWESIAKKQRRGQLKIRESSCGKTTKDSLNTPFSLLVENQIFPLNYNDFSLVEKELLYNTLVNSCFAKAFSLINQNRQLLDFLVDYLLRFQILRQHQILYIFSTLLVGCNKSHITLVNL